MDLSEFCETFFEEADELLVEIESHLLDIDLDNPDEEQLNAVFRAAHSIKGGAGTFGFAVLQETTHLLENLLDDARRGELALNRSIVDQFLETKDMLKEQLDAYRSGVAPDQADFEARCKALQRIADENRERASSATPDSDSESAASQSEDTVKDPGDFELFDHTTDSARALLVNLLNVDEKDRSLVLEELGQIGSIVSSSGDREKFTIVLRTDDTVEDLEAVLFFVIDAEQLEITETRVSSVVPEPQDSAVPNELPDEHRQTGADSSVEARESESEATAKPEAVAAKSRNSSSGESSTIRVSVDKVDQVINLVGELIITQSMLNETVNSIQGMSNNSDLLSGVNLLQRNARDLQDAVMSIRMLPMDYVFNRFPRMVRDMAGKLEKEILLVTEGESTELDKGLTERIIDPLTHLVRNSLDHGIELPEVREAAGKPREGKLVLSAQHQGGNIMIEVRDDGAGLDREKILAKARANNIAISDKASDEEVWQLIFAPGFSTADQVSDLSGRGVGMDVVKRNINAMGGHVEILSQTGQGTSTRIMLPLTLAILDGMLIRVAGEIYILPVSAIIESLQLRDENLSSLPGNVPMLKVRDEYYPVVSIYEAMGMQATRAQPTEGGRKTAVMVQGGSTKYIMLVDELLGQQQVVVKNLESNYQKVPGVSAATILGDGSVALILDISDIYRLGCDNRSTAARARGKQPVAATSAGQKIPIDRAHEVLLTHPSSDVSEGHGAVAPVDG